MTDKQMRRWVKAAKAAGWTVARTNKGHVTFFPPDKTIPPVVASATPSDHRSRKNTKALLKRSGLDVGNG